MNCKVFVLLLVLIVGSCTPTSDPNEEKAIQENTLIIFVSDQGQRRAPYAAFYFNQQMKERNLPFYATYRSSNPYDERNSIKPNLLKKHKETFKGISEVPLKPISDADFDHALSIIHVGKLNHSLRMRDVRKVNQWNIPEMVDNDWELVSKLIELSVDNLIATLTTG